MIKGQTAYAFDRHNLEAGIKEGKVRVHDIAKNPRYVWFEELTKGSGYELHTEAFETKEAAQEGFNKCIDAAIETHLGTIEKLRALRLGKKITVPYLVMCKKEEFAHLADVLGLRRHFELQVVDAKIEEWSYWQASPDAYLYIDPERKLFGSSRADLCKSLTHDVPVVVPYKEYIEAVVVF